MTRRYIRGYIYICAAARDFGATSLPESIYLYSINIISMNITVTCYPYKIKTLTLLYLTLPKQIYWERGRSCTCFPENISIIRRAETLTKCKICWYKLTQDRKSVVAVIVIIWTSPIILDLNFAKWFSSKNVYLKHICFKNNKICIKMPQGKTLDIKPGKRTNDHKSKLGIIPNPYFQACWRIIPISCCGQQAQT